jgi:N-acetylglucosaminyldiphosphoundecaprenol N-acetyl-beta-D-mannosaminyltransferase
MENNMTVKTVEVLGVPVSLVDFKTVVKVVEEKLSKSSVLIVTPNPEHVVTAYNNISFKKILTQADLAVADGIGLVWASRIKLLLNPDTRKCWKSVGRVAGSDLIFPLLRIARERRWVVGLLGGRKGVAEKTAMILEKKFSDLKIEVLPAVKNITERNSNEDTKTVQIIRQKQVKMLFIAYGAPVQEQIASEYIRLVPTLEVVMGVGGAFDFISGKLKRAPVWIQKIGLEWLFRLFQEPWRWRRQMRLITFVWLFLVRDLFSFKKRLSV